MGAGRGLAEKKTQTVEREIVTPTQVETTTEAQAPRMAGETFLSASKRYNPVTTTKVTPGSVTREREEVPAPPAPSQPQSTGNPIFDLFLKSQGKEPGAPRSR
jgi:hypothetical protein